MTSFENGNRAEFLQRTDHYSAHVALWTYDNVLRLIVGITRSSNQLTTFGGKADVGETVCETAIREFQEETLGSIYTEGELRSILTSSPDVISFCRISGVGKHYNFYVFVDALPTNFAACEAEYAKRINDPVYTPSEDYMEIARLTELPFNNIMTELEAGIITDVYGNRYEIRSEIRNSLMYFIEQWASSVLVLAHAHLQSLQHGL